MIREARTKAKIGDRVIICEKGWQQQMAVGSFDRKYGIVIDQCLSDDIAHHGSPLYETITVVEDDEGKRYEDFRTHNLQTEYRFYTEEEYISAVNYVITEKENELKEKYKRYAREKDMLQKEFSPDIKKIKSYDFLVDSVVNKLKQKQLGDVSYSLDDIE